MLNYDTYTLKKNNNNSMQETMRYLTLKYVTILIYIFLSCV